MEEIKRILTEMGLSSYKQQTYLALLRIGSGTVHDIAKNSQVPACKLYENLKWLHEQGYATLISQKPLSFRANNPKTVLGSEIEKNLEKLEELKKELEKVEFNLPVAERDIIQVTNTRDAYFRKIKESVRGSKKSIFYIARSWKIDAELVRLLNEGIKRGVKIKALGPINKKEKTKINWLKEIGVKVRNFNPKETHFAVYDHSLVIISLRKEPKKSDYSAIWLWSETLAKILANYFNALWKKAER